MPGRRDTDRPPRPAAPARARAEPDSASRVMAVLDCFATDRQWGVRGLAHRTGLARSTAHRILQSLTASGFLAFEPQKRTYEPGAELFRLALQLAASLDVGRLARPLLRELAERFDETAYLGLYRRAGDQVLLAETVESSRPVRFIPGRSEALPVIYGASGKAVLAFLPEAERERVLREAVPHPLTAATVTDRGRLRRELDAIRSCGYALSRGERVPEAASVAAPVWDGRGEVVASVILALPLFRFDPAREADYAEAVRRAAQRLSRHLGARVGLRGASRS